MNKITKSIAALSVGVLTFGTAYVTNVQSAQALPGLRTVNKWMKK